MTYRGHIRNGQVTLDQPVDLPEGARVRVDLIEDRQADRERMLRMPVEQRRSLLAQQSEGLAGYYEADTDTADWQGGDIME